VPGAGGKKNDSEPPKGPAQTEQEKTMIHRRYEELRCDVVQSEPGCFVRNRGLALFLRSGMLGWMEAWLQCKVVREQAEKRDVENPRQELPRDVRGQLVLLLANMAMQRREEVMVS
jgi:hypothetical protein